MRFVVVRLMNGLNVVGTIFVVDIAADAVAVGIIVVIFVNSLMGAFVEIIIFG